MKIPEGWPTQEMLEAARLGIKESKDIQEMSDEWFTKKFKAALAATPTPPIPVLQLETQLSDKDIKALQHYLMQVGAAPTPPAQHWSGNELAPNNDYRLNL